MGQRHTFSKQPCIFMWNLRDHPIAKSNRFCSGLLSDIKYSWPLPPYVGSRTPQVPAFPLPTLAGPPPQLLFVRHSLAVCSLNMDVPLILSKGLFSSYSINSPLTELGFYLPPQYWLPNLYLQLRAQSRACTPAKLLGRLQLSQANLSLHWT